MSSFAGKNVMVTGGLGFIGSQLVIMLSKLGAIVTVVDSVLPEFGGNFFNIKSVQSKVTINISDMRDPYSLNTLVKGQDYIFHLAGQVSHGDSMRDPQTDLAVNCISTMNLVEACRYYNPEVRLIYTSTRQVYGVARRLPVTEEHVAVPIDVNGINKLAGEYYHLLYHRTYGLRSTVLRLTNTYGPAQQIRNNRQGFIGIFIRQALRKETICIYGTGRQVRDFNYVDDVVEALLVAALSESSYGNIYNLGSPSHYSLLDLVGMLQDIIGVDYRNIPFPDDKKIIDIGDYYGDYSKFHTLTGWHPHVDLWEGLEKTLRYYQENGEEYWV